VPVAGDREFRTLAAGGRTACGISNTGYAFCWGNGADGELGNGQFGVTATTPTPVAGGHQYYDVAIGAMRRGRPPSAARQ
jgi:hypothetical protein